MSWSIMKLFYQYECVCKQYEYYWHDDGLGALDLNNIQ